MKLIEDVINETITFSFIKKKIKENVIDNLTEIVLNSFIFNKEIEIDKSTLNNIKILYVLKKY